MEEIKSFPGSSENADASSLQKEAQDGACCCDEVDGCDRDAILADARAFQAGEVTIETLKTNPVIVEGDRALVIGAIHTLYAPSATREALDKAVADLKEASDHDDVYAATLLGVLYAEGNTVDKDASLAEFYLKKGRDLGGVTATYRLGILYLQDNPIRDVAKGVELVREAALKGLKEALNSLGDIYVKGVSVEKSESEAKKYYQLAADRLLGEAFYNLSTLASNEGKSDEAKELAEKASLYGYDAEKHTQNYLLLAYQG